MAEVAECGQARTAASDPTVVIRSQHQRILLPQDVIRLAVGDTTILSADLVTSREVLILGRETGRTSLAFSADYRASDHDRLSVAFQSTQNYVDFFARQFNFNLQRVSPRQTSSCSGSLPSKSSGKA